MLTLPLLPCLLCHFLSWLMCRFVLVTVPLLSCLQCHFCPPYSATFVPLKVPISSWLLCHFWPAYSATFVLLTMQRWSCMVTVLFHFCPAYCAIFVLLTVPLLSWLLCHFRPADFAAGPASCLITIISSRGFDCLALCLYYSSVCNNLLFLQETDMRRKNPLWYESRMWWRDK